MLYHSKTYCTVQLQLFHPDQIVLFKNTFKLFNYSGGEAVKILHVILTPLCKCTVWFSAVYQCKQKLQKFMIKVVKHFWNISGMLDLNFIIELSRRCPPNHQNVDLPIMSILTNCTLGSWKDFDVDLSLIGSEEMIRKTYFDTTRSVSETLQKTQQL